MTAKTKKTNKKMTKAPAKTQAKLTPSKKSLKPVKTAAKTSKPAVKVKAKAVSVKKTTVKAAPAKAAKTVAAKAAKPAVKVAAKTTVTVKQTSVTVKTVAVAAPAVTVKPLAPSLPLPAALSPRPLASQQTVRPAVPAAFRSMNPMAARSVAARPANDTPVDFRSGDYVVYPAHGVGTIEGIETQSIGGLTVTLYAITFEKDRMRLKIPVQKAQASGLRKLSSGDRLKDALKTLQGKAKVKRTMWSRRAQEYEAKINSGDPVQIAEVLRDLRRPKDDTEQSYSERQIYQSALERLAREVAAVQRIAETKAVEHLETVLSQAA